MPASFAAMLFWVAVACCAVAQGLILRSVLAGRATTPAAAMPRPRRAAEAVWAVVPALALAMVLAATWRRVQPRPVAVAPPTGVSATVAAERS